MSKFETIWLASISAFIITVISLLISYYGVSCSLVQNKIEFGTKEYVDLIDKIR